MSFVESTIQKSLNISIITKIELLCWKSISQQETDIINSFLGFAKIHCIDHRIAENTVLVRKLFNLKLPDALISATALVEDFILVTADSQFNRVNDLNTMILKHL